MLSQFKYCERLLEVTFIRKVAFLKRFKMQKMLHHRNAALQCIWWLMWMCNGYAWWSHAERRSNELAEDKELLSWNFSMVTAVSMVSLQHSGWVLPTISVTIVVVTKGRVRIREYMSNLCVTKGSGLQFHIPFVSYLNLVWITGTGRHFSYNLVRIFYLLMQ